MNALEIFDILTNRRVFVRVSNLKIDGLNESGQPQYSRQIKVTIGKDGIELATFVGDSLEAELNNAYKWAIDNKVIKNAPEYLPQCESCMYRIGGQVLGVCKDPESQYRHADWNGSKSHDHCLYKLYWNNYPESHWRSILTPEQFKVAQSIIEREKRATTQGKGAKQ